MSKAETVRIGKLGEKDLRLVRKDGRFFGLADGKLCVEGESADDVWRRLHDDAGKADPKYSGFDGARARFLRFFPNGFHSGGYAGQERDYKLAAKAKLDATAPLETTPASARRCWAFSALPTCFLHSSRRPDLHMFLKPEATRDFATRVGHRFAEEYESRLRLSVYESLLALVDRTATELADMTPRDRIDIQSFIWVVGTIAKTGKASTPECKKILQSAFRKSIPPVDGERPHWPASEGASRGKEPLAG